MITIRIEEVGDINFDYNYLEVFIGKETDAFMEVGISEQKELVVTLYPTKENVTLNFEDLTFLSRASQQFLKSALINNEQLKQFDKDNST